MSVSSRRDGGGFGRGAFSVDWRNSSGMDVRPRALLLLLLLLGGGGPAEAASSMSNSVSALSTDFRCMVCHWGADLVVAYARGHHNMGRFLSLVTNMCSFFGIEEKSVCRGMVDSVGPQLFDIIRASNGKASSKDICGMVNEGACAKQSWRMTDWKLNIPDLDADPVPGSPAVPPADVAAAKKLRVLHLSDIHLQKDYKIGSNAECSEPICCISSSTGGAAHDSSPFRAASFFGDYNCDIPPWTLDVILRDLARRHRGRIDLVLLTGDYPPHDVWRQTRRDNVESSKLVADVVRKHFSDVPVFPAVGNHESYPVNMFPAANATGKYNPTWLYSGLASFYRHWLPGREQQLTLTNGGYYQVSVRPGLRLVAVNTNYCNNLNFFLLLNFNDPSGHLHWIYSVLKKAEEDGEKVIIIGHIPPGRKSCFNQWSHEYNRLVRRFRHVISGQFFGHTHFDEFEVFFDDKAASGERPVGVAYLGPSVTTMRNINPSYRIYDLDNSTNQVLDHETFYYDLKASVLTRRLVHKSEYSARRDLDLPDLSPASWNDLALRMAANDTLFEQFRSYYYRAGPAAKAPCDFSCKSAMLCRQLTSSSGDVGHCARLNAVLKQNAPVKKEKKFFWQSLFR